MQTILIVDPETDFLEWAQNQLETATTRVLTATTADEGYKIYISENPDLMVSETHLLPFSGLELLARIRQRDTNAMVILMSAFGTTQSVIESIDRGYYAKFMPGEAAEEFRAVLHAGAGASVIELGVA